MPSHNQDLYTNLNGFVDQNSLMAPKVNPGSPLSVEPQVLIKDDFEFQVMSPSDPKDAVYDAEDDLATPLSNDLLRASSPNLTGIIPIHQATCDIDAAVRKYGYNFEEKDVPKRRALLVGIKGDGLKGSHNDVDDMKSLLMEVQKWEENEIMVLKDDDVQSLFYPTRQTVVDHLFILVNNARSGDRLFLHFSGHGSQVEDTDGDETDRLDEVICCADGGIIIDDQLHDILVKPLPRGCRLTALFDCCTSGTGLDLVKTPTGTPMATSPFLKPHDLEPDAFAGSVLDLPHSFESNEDVGNGTTATVNPRSPRKKSSEGDVIMWAACMDSTDSHEVVTDSGRHKGAMSHAFQECIRFRPEQSYRQLLAAILSMLKKWNVPQQPQVTSSQKLDRDALFHI